MSNSPSTILHVHYDYTSKQEDELTLKRGSQLQVLSTDELVSGSEGWWTGRLIDSESVGIFPANFVATSQPDLRIIPEKDLVIGDLIGVGGFGHVFNGRFGDVDVAIKTAKSLSSFSSIHTPTTHRKLDDDHQTKTLIEGLLREAQLFANLKHPNIIQLYGVCPSFSRQNVYLVMEYAHTALNQLLQQRQSGLSPLIFIHYAKQIAEGMKYLHNEADVHIIHRDLKCSNILILEPITDIHNDEELKEKTLKITDFGLAKRQMTSSSSSAAGTYPWMSPECIRNEVYSLKSDVWSFGVLLWECLTGEIPYDGFNQMQVAFGVATRKYSLPIPSSCPDAFAQLMKKCWLFSPQDRPSFIELCDEIKSIIERDYPDHQLVNNQSEKKLYQSLQQDWRAEIKQIFEQFKNIEQDFRDREQLIIKHNDELNEQRTALEQREQDLREREMHLIEMQMKLIVMKNFNNSEINHSQAPRLFKRTGRFMRSLLPAARIGCSIITSNASHIVISEPKNFRHLASIDRDRQFHIPNSQTEPLLTIRSTPNTPLTNRARTLTSPEDPDDPPLLTNEIPDPSTSEPESDGFPHSNKTRSSSECPKKRSKRRRPWRTEKTSPSPKPSRRHGEAKWYLDSESISSVSTNNIDTISLSSARSTPTLDLPTKRLVSASSDDFSSSTSSVYTNPTDHSLARGIFDITSMLMTIVLGRSLPSPNSLDFSSRPKLSTSSSVSFTPPPLPKKQHKRTVSSPIENVNEEVTFRARPCYSPVRPNSLVLNPIPPPPASFHSTPDSISQSDSQLNQNRRTYPSRMSSTPEEAETDDQNNSTTTTNKCHLSKSAQQLHFSSLLDIETDEQRRHQTEVLPPEIDRKKVFIPLEMLERDFLP